MSAASPALLAYHEEQASRIPEHESLTLTLALVNDSLILNHQHTVEDGDGKSLSSLPGSASSSSACP